MNESVTSSMVIRPVSSKRGSWLLFYCLLAGLLFAAIALLVYTIAPGGDPKARTLMMVMGIVSAIVIILGIIFYLVFPRVKFIFDSSRQEVITKGGSKAGTIIPFSSLEPFQIYHVLRGYAHQYYCRNGSFGEFSDLFFSAYHKRALKKAQKLAALTGTTLIDHNGKVVS